MEKKTVKAVTRKQKYLAAITGDGVAPSPITSDEKLMYNIAEKMNNGGGSGGVTIVHEVEEYGDTLLSGVLPDVSGYAWRSEVESGHNVYYVDIAVELGDANIDDIYVLIGDMRFYNDDATRLSYSNGVLSIKAGWSGQSAGYDVVTRESDIIGKDITIYANLVTRLDKTYKEITDAGFAVLYADANGQGTHVLPLAGFSNPEASMLLVGFGSTGYFADDPNDYPVLAQ